MRHLQPASRHRLALLFLLFSTAYTGTSYADGEESPPWVDILHWKAVALEAQHESNIIESVAALAAIDHDDAPDAISVVLNERARSAEFIPAYRIIDAARGAEITDDSNLWRTLEWIRGTGVHWHDRVVAAELLAIHGDQTSLDFLITAYDESRVLLPGEQVRQYVGEAVAKVDDPLAGAYLAEHASSCDPNHLLRRLSIMLRHDNPQAVVVARAVLKHDDSYELDLMARLIVVFEHYGDKDDLPLLKPLLSEYRDRENEDDARLAASLADLIQALESRE